MTLRQNFALFAPVAAAAMIVAAGLALAGPLDPPSGPVAGTYKTLSEVEPRTLISQANTPGDGNSVFRITQPGSYYLAGNVQGVASKHGIQILTDGVTLDLCGFTLQGVAGSRSGVSAPSTERVVVRNGIVHAFGASGVDLAFSESCTVSDLTVDSCLVRGLNVGANSRVERVTARNNSGAGILASTGSTLTGCIVTANQTGLEVRDGSIVRECQASLNSGYGFRSTGNGCTFEGCTASANTTAGFSLSSNDRVERSVARNNVGHGIEVNDSAYVTASVCAGNGGFGATGAGIYVASGVARARIESNTCSGNPFGVKVDGTSNLVIGNRCTLNTTNFVVVSGNRVGPIVVLPVSGAISGNSGGAGAADAISNLAF